MRLPNSLRTTFIKKAVKNGMKVLVFDTETSHMIVRTFYIGQKVSIQHTQVKVPNKVITIQYKWLHERTAKYLEWSRTPSYYGDSRDFDDSNMIEEFSTKILDKADIVIGQNSDNFDIKVLNERAKELHLTPVDLKPSIDILKLSRKSVRAASHKLDYRSAQQGLGGKIKMLDSDWIDIEENNVPVTKKMVPYGLKDVIDTEKLFWKELPYYKDLPVAVERVILKYLEVDKPDTSYIKNGVDTRYPCVNCKKAKRGSMYNTRVTGNIVRCKNCKASWRSK